MVCICVYKFYLLQGYIGGTFRGSQSLLIIEHDFHFSLYLSDETGTYYSLSLEDIVVQYYNPVTGRIAIDLEIVSNLLGI